MMIEVSANGSKIPVEAFPCSIPGLLVTQISVTEPTEGYRITHEKSGVALSPIGLPSVELAELFAKRIKDFVFWDQDITWTDSSWTGEVKGSGDRAELRAKLTAAIEKFQEELEKNPADLIRQTIEG